MLIVCHGLLGHNVGERRDSGGTVEAPEPEAPVLSSAVQLSSFGRQVK